MEGLQWEAPDFNTSLGEYVMPLETQFYIGFYNKALFKKAGITTSRRTGPAFCRLQVAQGKGIEPLVYGNGGQAISTEFYPWYDMSYLMIGAHPLASWKDLYDGATPWTSSTNEAQLTKWPSWKRTGTPTPAS